MTGQTIILRDSESRYMARCLVEAAPSGAVLNIREARRTSEQNDKLWAMLSDISRAKPLGRHHTPDDWKALAMNACGWECQFIEGLDGRPFPQGFRSSRLTKAQMSTLIEWLYAFGAEHSIEWTEPKQEVV